MPNLEADALHLMVAWLSRDGSQQRSLISCCPARNEWKQRLIIWGTYPQEVYWVELIWVWPSVVLPPPIWMESRWKWRLSEPRSEQTRKKSTHASGLLLKIMMFICDTFYQEDYSSGCTQINCSIRSAVNPVYSISYVSWMRISWTHVDSLPLKGNQTLSVIA